MLIPRLRRSLHYRTNESNAEIKRKRKCEKEGNEGIKKELWKLADAEEKRIGREER
jgi:hypothetical protein